MPELVLPTPSVRESFLEAMDEFVAEGAEFSQTAAWIEHHAPGWKEPAAFAAFVDAVKADALPETPRLEWHVPCTTLWWIDGEDYLGRLAIRHELTEFLLDVGGHIGYDVRPTRRREGHATEMLKQALPWALGLGIDPALVTCDDDNVGSVRVIEAAGGELEDVRGKKRRYWVPTSAAAATAGHAAQEGPRTRLRPQVPSHGQGRPGRCLRQQSPSSTRPSTEIRREALLVPDSCRSESSSQGCDARPPGGKFQNSRPATSPKTWPDSRDTMTSSRIVARPDHGHRSIGLNRRSRSLAPEERHPGETCRRCRGLAEDVGAFCHSKARPRARIKPLPHGPGNRCRLKCRITTTPRAPGPSRLATERALGRSNR